jgi:DNA polymerase
MCGKGTKDDRGKQEEQMSKKSDKLEQLSKFCDLESGSFINNAFADLFMLYEKGKKYHRLCHRLRKCNYCPGLNVRRVTEVVCGWGNLNADVMFVGQSAHDLGVYSGLPFILGSGFIIDAVLRLSGLDRRDCFLSNAIHCHPEKNRTSTEEEKENCWAYLAEEISIVQPRIIVALGRDAEQAVQRYMGEMKYGWKYLHYQHPASLIYSAPETRPNYIVKMSLDLDKALY